MFHHALWENVTFVAVAAGFLIGFQFKQLLKVILFV
jgi:hypothetical protein